MPVGPAGVVDGVKVNHVDVNVCGYVFDEIYFPVDAAKDLRQPAESYFDPEPPLAKLLMAPPIAFFGFNSWTWRLSTTLFGSLLVGMMYLVALRLRRDRFFALVTALFICFDGLAFVEFAHRGHRHHRDLLRRALLLRLLIALAGADSGAVAHHAVRDGRRRRARLCGEAYRPRAARCCGRADRDARHLAVPRGSSSRGCVASPVRAAQSRSMWRHAAGPRAILHYALAGIIALAIFAASFSRYETIQHTDVYFFTGCNPAVSGLPGTPKTLNVPVMKVGFADGAEPRRGIDNIVQITAASLRYHAEECHSHPYSSLWLTWPIMEHPVLFYASSQPNNGAVSEITDMGNPAIWWLGILALLFCVWRLTRGPNWWRLLVALIGLGSLVAMIIIYQSAVRFHDPTQLQHVVHGCPVHCAIPHGSVIAVRDRSNVSRLVVCDRVRWHGCLCGARRALRGDLAAFRARVHHSRLRRVVDDVGARQRTPRPLLLSRARDVALHRACPRVCAERHSPREDPVRWTERCRWRQSHMRSSRACSRRSSSSTRSGRPCRRALPTNR